MILRSFNIRLQVIDTTLGHFTASLMLGERIPSDPGRPAEIAEARLPLAFDCCDLGQPARARRLLSVAQAPAGSYMALMWKEAGLPVYRGVVWRALIEVFEHRDTALASAIAHHLPTESSALLRSTCRRRISTASSHRNPFNALLLGKVRERSR